jgi:hypothetical protein
MHLPVRARIARHRLALVAIGLVPIARVAATAATEGTSEMGPMSRDGRAMSC